LSPVIGTNESSTVVVGERGCDQFARRIVMPYKDPARQRAAERKWYRENRQLAFDKKNRKRARLREIAREAKARPCADCGLEYPYYVMDFDHVDGDKRMIISQLINFGSIGRLLAEIAKCEVVCANCHRVRTWERLGPLDAKTRPARARSAAPPLFDLGTL